MRKPIETRPLYSYGSFTLRESYLNILSLKEVTYMPDILWFIIIGIIAGWLAGLIMKGRGFGILGDLVVGVVGAILGGLIFDFFGVGAGGIIGNIIMAVIGAVVLLFIAGLFRRGSSTAV